MTKYDLTLTKAEGQTEEKVCAVERSYPNISVGQILKRYLEYFYGHSLPSADSRRAVVSFWRKNVHNTV